ncbi:52 kDa repressor of the inhibitor of the protein kinase-like [Hydra vulgaris]|uniref:52 kDa repressor of the inhibitor of the protein kinase-like n=1 Tax=Hydra vulgaris TaxID=6087 RepID=A0ABM4B105_HYDVU
MNGIIQNIDILINKKYEKEVALNWDILHSIVDSIIFLGHLDIVFRGYRDNSQHHPTVGKYSLVNGVGNFVELLNYRIRGGDKVLEHYLNSCAKNASHISSSSQNELINCCGKYIRNILFSDIKENQFFSIIADEAFDCSNQKQMSLFLRFIDSSFRTIYNVREEFMGQGYDGAGSVAGHFKSLAKRIKDHNDKAVFSLQNLLEAAITKHCPSAAKKKLIDVCHTRWVERITGLDDFESLFVPIVFCLKGMSMNLEKKCNKETSSQASCFLKLITTFDFIASLVVTQTVLD